MYFLEQQWIGRESWKACLVQSPQQRVRTAGVGNTGYVCAEQQTGLCHFLPLVSCLLQDAVCTINKRQSFKTALRVFEYTVVYSLHYY